MREASGLKDLASVLSPKYLVFRGQDTRVGERLINTTLANGGLLRHEL
jgi:hypothetical protein